MWCGATCTPFADVVPKKGVDDEGSKVLDITMYNEFDEGTCNCDDAYCKEQATVCCVTLPDGTDIDATFEGRNNKIIGNVLGSALNGVEGRGDSIDGQFTPYSSGNSAGFAESELRDPYNFDFRPRSGTLIATNDEGAYDIDAEWTLV